MGGYFARRKFLLLFVASQRGKKHDQLGTAYYLSYKINIPNGHRTKDKPFKLTLLKIIIIF